MKHLATLFLFTHLLLATVCEKITLQPHGLEQFQFAGYYMAQENGYYNKERLSLHILPYQENSDITKKVLATCFSESSSCAIYGIGNSSLVLDILENKKIVLLKAILQESPIIILSLTKNRLRNSKNRRIMVSKKDSKDIVFQSILANHSIQLGYDLKPIYQTPKISDLIENKTDFMIAYKSDEPYLLKGYNISDYHFFPADTLGLKFYSDILFTSQKELDEHPHRVKRFTDATIKGWLWAFNHIEETAEFIYQYHNEQNRSLEALIFEGYALKKMALKKGTEFGEIISLSLKNIENSYRGRGMTQNLKLIHNYNDYIYQPWYIKLKYQLQLYKFYLLLLFLLLLTIMIYWNYLLKKRVQEELAKRLMQEELAKQRNNLLIKADKQIKMETYIAHASHQLKSPLNTITSIINNIKRDVQSVDFNRELLDRELIKIETQSLMMKETINFFLKYLSDEHEKKYFSINETIHKTLGYIDDFLKQDLVNVTFEPKEDFNYFGYEIQLVQVFQTIFENAIQALVNKKEERIITIDMDADEDNLITIFISDNGKGIPKKYLNKIFDPYFSTKKHTDMKGLGLNIAKIIIEENLKGSIEAYNDNGAVFKLMLPSK